MNIAIFERALAAFNAIVPRYDTLLEIVRMLDRDLITRNMLNQINLGDRYNKAYRK